MRDDVPRCVMIAIGYSRKKTKKKKEADPENEYLFSSF